MRGDFRFVTGKSRFNHRELAVDFLGCGTADHGLGVSVFHRIQRFLNLRIRDAELFVEEFTADTVKHRGIDVCCLFIRFGEVAHNVRNDFVSGPEGELFIAHQRIGKFRDRAEVRCGRAACTVFADFDVLHRDVQKPDNAFNVLKAGPEVADEIHGFHGKGIRNAFIRHPGSVLVALDACRKARGTFKGPRIFLLRHDRGTDGNFIGHFHITVVRRCPDTHVGSHAHQGACQDGNVSHDFQQVITRADAVHGVFNQPFKTEKFGGVVTVNIPGG